MDVLNDSPRRVPPPARIGLWVLVSVVVGSCLLGTRDPGPHFSHAVHVVDEELDCDFCHATVRSSDTAGMPPPQLCAPCHDEIDADKPPGRRLEAFYDEDNRFEADPIAAVSDEIKFSHRSHVREHGVTCAECHGDAGRSDVLPAESAVTKSECMTCHAERGKSNDCATCHRRIRSDWVPPDHEHLWTRRHGEVVRYGPEAAANRCSLCHERESECRTCHQEQEPRDHTHFWRLRGHGIAVAMDRTRCAVCHRRDFCQRCHETTRPISHVGGFGGSTHRHCVGCHFPLQETGCFTCHKQTVGHSFAAPLPSWHNPAANCRQCHGLSEPLPHPDGGHQCTACHR